ncbi:MAG: hypothetical protein ACK45H_09170 [Bacteroidota bacterium]|jgi:hypothetical protein
MKVLLPVLLAISTVTLAQKRSFEAFELGFDGSFNASSIGGVFEIGPKFGFVRHENLVFGPTLRYQRAWSQPFYSNESFSFNNLGGGFFVHGRYKNTIFGGLEAEIIRNRNVFIDTSAVFKKIVPTVFICAGFSREFKGIVRLNAGIYYDIINSLNSPFRSSYKITIKDPTTGQIVNRVPLIYRISFFFPIFKHRDVQDDSEFEESEP